MWQQCLNEMNEHLNKFQAPSPLCIGQQLNRCYTAFYVVLKWRWLTQQNPIPGYDNILTTAPPPLPLSQLHGGSESASEGSWFPDEEGARLLCHGSGETSEALLSYPRRVRNSLFLSTDHHVWTCLVDDQTENSPTLKQYKGLHSWLCFAKVPEKHEVQSRKSIWSKRFMH